MWMKHQIYWPGTKGLILVIKEAKVALLFPLKNTGDLQWIMFQKSGGEALDHPRSQHI